MHPQKLSVKALKSAGKLERRRLRGLERQDPRLERRMKERLEHSKKKRIERKKRKEDERLGLSVTRQTPNTIESMRRFDETMVMGGDVEIEREEKIDEFSEYFSGNTEPKLLLTTSRRPSDKVRLFMKELLLILPNSSYFSRDEFKMKDVVKHALTHKFTSILLVTQTNNKVPNGIYICTLPYGPTTFFKLSSIKLASDMKGGGVLTQTVPELVLNSFDTRLGRRIGRQLGSLFPQNPEFEGRRVITFHNQRDMIFFRHHRYVFNNENKCTLKEIGPRFTMKTYFVQEGLFDLERGLFEFVWRPDLQVDRKRFFI